MKITASLGVIIFLLGMLTPRQAKSRRPPVFLNHFYVVLDSATYKDIEQSPIRRAHWKQSVKSYRRIFLWIRKRLPGNTAGNKFPGFMPVS